MEWRLMAVTDSPTAPARHWEAADSLVISCCNQSTEKELKVNICQAKMYVHIKRSRPLSLRAGCAVAGVLVWSG